MKGRSRESGIGQVMGEMVIKGDYYGRSCQRRRVERVMGKGR